MRNDHQAIGELRCRLLSGFCHICGRGYTRQNDYRGGCGFFNAKRTDPCAPGRHATSGNVPIATLAFRCSLAHRGGCGVTGRGRVRVMPPRAVGAGLDSARG